MNIFYRISTIAQIVLGLNLTFCHPSTYQSPTIWSHTDPIISLVQTVLAASAHASTDTSVIVLVVVVDVVVVVAGRRRRISHAGSPSE